MAKKSIADAVINRIKSEDVRMKPHWHFVGLSALIAFAIALLGSISVYFINLITIAVRIQLGSTQMYGARQRLSELYAQIPWWQVVLVVCALTAIIVLLKKYSSLYKLGILKTIVLVLVCGIILGVVFSYTPFGYERNHNHRGAPQSERIHQNK